PFPPNYFLTFLEKREENGRNGHYGLNGQGIRLFVHHAHGVPHVLRSSLPTKKGTVSGAFFLLVSPSLLAEILDLG
ncbi:MAG: hypothetical protein LWW75_01540, partial [Chlorobiales bacterium]|nr:hypothetical protein [Chlorobiales bacterium]